MKITRELLLQVLEQNPIAECFRHCQLFQLHGRVYTCCCPFHSEKTPSCVIDSESCFFYCHGCGVGGDVITFTQITEKLSYEEAFAVLAEKIKNPQNPEYSDFHSVFSQKFIRNRCYAINRETANFYYWNLLHGNDRRGLNYFAQRRLSAGIVRKYGLGFAPDDWHQLRDFLRNKGFSDEELILSGVCRRSEKQPENLYDNFRNRVTFPILNTAGNIIGFGGRVLDDSKPKYLNTSETPVFDKSSNLFSLHFAQHVSSEMLILAEGYMDVIAMHQAGFENVVATLGTAITSQQARLIARYTKQVIIAYDSDNAGQNATEKALRHFEAIGLQARILRIENAKDPDEFLKKYGREKFRELLERAQDTVSFRISRCRNDLDLQTEQGKTIFLRRCVPILSHISNDSRRKNHIFRIAEDLEIDPGILDKQVIRT
ncbi:MAG: DNA primase, partial [Oscillospiraceae bacterium]|nr:DNA primase [Oscillospiraceae bacterium]